MNKENKIELAALSLTPEETSKMIEESMKTGKPLPFTIADMWPVNIIKKD
jgi:hypothetical protein